jgi:hypothetical protein
VTITGAGFQKSAMIDYTTPGNGAIQASTKFVNSTTMTAGIYFGSATTATFYAVNPGSAPSSSLAIPVGGVPKYSLGVMNGSGSGRYAAGTVVTITANAAQSGETFSASPAQRLRPGRPLLPRSRCRQPTRR